MTLFCNLFMERLSYFLNMEQTYNLTILMNMKFMNNNNRLENDSALSRYADLLQPQM